MVVELRKRKAPAAPVPAPAPKKRAGRPTAAAAAKKVVAKAKATKAKVASSATAKVLKVGETIDLDSFEDEISLQDGTSTSLKKLLDESESGVVLFTYPKASTPGCKC
jgi:peroxiredoxin Q/BCP